MKRIEGGMEFPAELNRLLRELFFRVKEALQDSHLQPERLRDLDRLSGQLSRLVSDTSFLEQIQRERREYAVFRQISNKLGRDLDVPSLMDLILDALRDIFSYDAGGIYLIDPDTRRVLWETIRGYQTTKSQLVRKKLEAGIMGSVIRTGKPIILGDVHLDPRYINARESTRSEIAAPIMHEGRPIGCFNLESDRYDAFSEADLHLLQAFIQQATLALERAKLHQERIERRRLEGELDIARQIQQDLLPEGPLSAGEYEIVGRTIPSRQVGGDYHDYFPVSENDVAVVVGDVSGKGVPAAIIMASFRAGIRLSAETEYEIKELMSRVNNFLWESTDEEYFVTSFYGVINQKEHILTFVNAGHNPPLLVRANGSLQSLKTGGLLLGAFPGVAYEQGVVTMAPGDLCFLYTDGVTEIRNEKGEEFGEERLRRFLLREQGQAPEELIRKLLTELQEFAEHPEERDDITLLIIRRKGEK